MKYKRKITIMLLAVLVSLCGCRKIFRTDAPMNSFSFSHSGMHTGLIYTLSAAKIEEEWFAELSLLAGKQEYRLAMTNEEVEKLAALVKEHHLTAWDGFDKSDRRGADGYDFTLKIGYADGQTVYASGSNAFPKGYAAAHAAILGFFGEMMENNGIDNPF